MNMLQSGLQWLSEKQKKHSSSKVLYCRNDKKFSVDAVFGSTKYDVVDENGFRVSAHKVDFLIRASDLPLIPKNGDQIIAGSVVYEVADLGDGCWRWCDPHGFMRRIHTNIFTERK